MSGKSEIYRAVSAIAYAIAKADGGLQDDEKKAFKSIIIEEFGHDAWMAESRFDLLDDMLQPTIEHSYNDALSVIKSNRQSFNEELRDKSIRIMERVAEAYKGKNEMEGFIIEKFKQDLSKL